MKKITILFTLLMLLPFSPFSQEIIQNPGKPLSPDAGRILKVEEVFRITDESGKFFFTRPSGLQVAKDESLFLTDENQFLKFSSDGKYLKNIFKKGQGPGEIAGAFFYYHLKGEKIAIYDPMNNKIIFMDQEGNLIEEFRLTARYPQFIGLWEDKLIFTKYFWPAVEEQAGKVFNIPGKILFISREGNIVGECPGIPMKRFLHPNLAIRIPVLATQISEDGKFCFIGGPDEYMVSVLDLEKLEFIRKFKREYPRVKRKKMETPPRGSIKIPEIKYENDIVDLYNFKGNLWIETSTDDDKKGTLYDVFSIEGQYIDCFWLNVGGSLLTTHGDFLFVREQDEDGSMSIVKYRVLEMQSDSNKNIEVPISWSNKRDLPEPRIQGGAVSCGKQFYYIGGRDSRRQKQNTVFKYSPGNDDWTASAPIPTPRWNFASTESQGKIYAIGGDILISKTEVYDPGTNSWETLSPLPTQRVSAGCVAIGDLIYVIGGWEEDTKPSVKNEAFNIKTQKWETKAPLPSPRMSFGTASFNRKIYILGGTGEMLSKPIDGKGSYFFKPEKTILVYDPQEDSWEKLESEIPIVRIGAKAVIIDDFIFLLGGYTVDNKRNESFLARVDILDPKRNIWLRGTDLPKKLLFSGIALSDDSIFVIGGWDEHYKATSIVLEGKPVLNLR